MTAPPGQTLVGRSVPRREDRPLLTGAAQFVADLEMPGVGHVAFLRSPAAHARIVAVDAQAARSMSGVRAVFTAADVPLGPLHPAVENPDAYSPPRPLLAEGRTRFVGEPVAVVVADDPYRAEDAAEAVELDLEPLDPLVDPEAACRPDAVELHDGHPNVLYDHSFDAGDVDGALARAAVVVEREFRNPRYSATPMEGRGLVAAPAGDGIDVWSSTQGPHRLATLLAQMLELDQDLVRVLCPDIGGAFGQKAHVYPEDVLVAWLALETGAPVRWIEDRAENLLASSHARDQQVRVKVGADEEGRLLAVEADVLCDQGAYGVFPHGHILEALGTPAMIPGPYRLDNYRFRSRVAATNKAPEGAYRGVGLPVSAFVHERMMDVLAAELDLDRAEIRRRNLIGPDELPRTTVTNQRYDSGDYPEALTRALETADYAGFAERQREARAHGRLLGFGMSCYVEYSGINSAVFQGRGMVEIAGYDSAHVAVREDGQIEVWTTLPAIGQGSETTFAQVMADVMGTDGERVSIVRPDTSVGGLHGTGTFASRSAIAGSGAILEAGAEVRRRLFDDAADQMEANPLDLELRGDSIGVVGAPGRSVAVSDLVAAGDPDRYRVSARFDPPALAYPYATHLCEIEVDPDTGRLEILRWVIVEDCGTVINPAVVEGQVHGATAQGIGGALLEEIVYSEEGQLTTASLMDYLVPTASELPPFEVGHLEIPAPGNPAGAKGVGEGGTLAPPGALANAVTDALGREFNTLPLRPEQLMRAASAALAGQG